MKRFLLLIALLLATASLVGVDGCEPTGATYYVSPSGNDTLNNGSINSPWKTIAASLPKLDPNEKLLVRSGTYNELVNVTVTPGDASNPVWVQAYPGEEPKITGRLWVQYAHYWTFDNIDVTWPASGLTSSDQMVRMRNSHDWRFTNSNIGNARSTAAFGIGSGQYNFAIDHNIVHDTYESNGPNQDHLIYAENDHDVTPPVGIIERNLLLNSPNGRAIKIGRGSQSTTPAGGLIIRYNTMVNNTGPSNIQLSYGAASNEIYRNIMVTTDGSKNITRFTGIGSGNTAHDNIGWDSGGVVDVGTGLADTGGNQYLNPQLNGFYIPTNSAATNYGWQAP